ncbi:hypothetical protein G9F31_14540 [Acinetobacter sp. 187]|uniref:YCII-related domain-containing protein n=1 Tax=Acinetobacter lanii TaxID=2715163 RepID=A0A6G8S1G9_9GAMM|nr:YciI family protein [Acinetobacter lanii]NHC04960.1 hypothetical protein [Acinetobacter lanii]QIO07965.1 hypothetical protein G8D99_02295 [Acinetobacter lanii]
MALFVITCTDAPGTVEKRLATRPQHLARLEQLDAEGRVIVAGAMPIDRENPQHGFYGSTLILDFDTREELDAWLAEEPFLKEGIYSHIDVKPFNKALPNGK